MMLFDNRITLFRAYLYVRRESWTEKARKLIDAMTCNLVLAAALSNLQTLFYQTVHNTLMRLHVENRTFEPWI